MSVRIDVSDENRGRSIAGGLAALGVPVSSTQEPGEVVVREAELRVRSGPRREEVGEATVQLWAGPRNQRIFNPFALRSTRHVLSFPEAVDPVELASTLRYLKEGVPLSLESVLGQVDHEQTFEETSSTRAPALVDALNAFADMLEERPNVRSALESALDELYTNAVYNAPWVEGRRPYAALSRAEVVESPQPVVVRFGANADYVALAVRDSYGSLSPDMVLDALHRCYCDEVATAENKEGGAGLGFYVLLRNSSRLVINVDPGRSTEIIVVRRRNENGREFVQRQPTFNLCVAETPAGTVFGRRTRRHQVEWSAHLGRGAMTVRDISAEGMFVQDEGASIGVGSRVSGLIVPSDGSVPVLVNARVCWAGRSRMHRCAGLGLEFEHPVGFVVDPLG